jgi:hypothetical protein
MVAVKVTFCPRIDGLGVAVTTTEVLSTGVTVGSLEVPVSGSSVRIVVKLLPDTDPWVLTCVTAGCGLLMVPRNVIVKDLPAASVKPEPLPFTVTVSTVGLDPSSLAVAGIILTSCANAVGEIISLTLVNSSNKSDGVASALAVSLASSTPIPICPAAISLTDRSPIPNSPTIVNRATGVSSAAGL